MVTGSFWKKGMAKTLSEQVYRERVASGVVDNAGSPDVGVGYVNPWRDRDRVRFLSYQL